MLFVNDKPCGEHTFPRCKICTKKYPIYVSDEGNQKVPTTGWHLLKYMTTGSAAKLGYNEAVYQYEQRKTPAKEHTSLTTIPTWQQYEEEGSEEMEEYDDNDNGWYEGARFTSIVLEICRFVRKIPGTEENTECQGTGKVRKECVCNIIARTLRFGGHHHDCYECCPNCSGLGRVKVLMSNGVRVHRKTMRSQRTKVKGGNSDLEEHRGTVYHHGFLDRTGGHSGTRECQCGCQSTNKTRNNLPTHQEDRQFTREVKPPRKKFAGDRDQWCRRLAAYDSPPTDGWGPWKAVPVDHPNYQRDLRRFMASKAPDRSC